MIIQALLGGGSTVLEDRIAGAFRPCNQICLVRANRDFADLDRQQSPEQNV